MKTKRTEKKYGIKEWVLYLDKRFFAEIKNQHILIKKQRGNDTCYFKISGLNNDSRVCYVGSVRNN